MPKISSMLPCLVFLTSCGISVHSNDAASAFTRLIDMGIEPYLVASTVVGVLAQRLVRVLCPACKEAFSPRPSELPDDFSGAIPERLWRAVGCRACRNTGYNGRTGVFELLTADVELRRFIVDRCTSTQIRDHSVSRGLTTLRQTGWLQAVNGITSPDEVIRITKSDLL